MPDGKMIAQDEQKAVHIGSYRVIDSSNVIVLVDNANTNTATVPFYFPSTDEVVLEFPAETRTDRLDYPLPNTPYVIQTPGETLMFKRQPSH